MKNTTYILLGLAVLLAFVADVPAQNKPSTETLSSDAGKVFQVTDPMNRNTVTFKSEAPLEDIIGTSNQITGQLVFDPANPEEGGSGEVSVPVKSLDTGIPLRNEHLASAGWLDADNHPEITFRIIEVKDIKPVKISSDAKTYDVVAVGDFSLKGRTERLSVPARVTWLKESEATRQRQPGDLLAVRASFDVALADFGVSGPSGMDIIGSKVGQSVSVELTFVASADSGAAPGKP